MISLFPPGSLQRWLVLGVVIVGTFMAVLDITIVNVVLPKIMTGFGVNVEQIKWVSTAFLLATAVGMPATGWLGRRFGLGRLYLAELAIFTFGSALCAGAWSLEVLVAARVIQALGAGAIMPTSMAIITETFPPGERGRALGIWGVGFMVGPAIGPTAGGFLTDWFNWRAVFAVNLPVGILAMLFTAAALAPGKKDPSARFDWKGFLALGTFLVAGLLTIDNGQEEGWGSAPILIGAAITVTAFLVFLAAVWDNPQPVLPLRLFRSPEFSLTIVLSFLRSAGFFGSLFMLPIFLQNVQGRDTIDVGLMLIPGAVGVAIFMPFAGMITDHFGARWPTVCGVLILAYSLFVYHGLDPLWARWPVIWPQIMRGIGITLLMTPVNTASLNAVPPEEAGNASWILNLTMTVGGALVIAMMGTLLQFQTVTQLDLLSAGPLNVAPLGLVEHVRNLGYSAVEARPLANAIFLRRIGEVASTLAYQNLFTLLSYATLLALPPALFLSTRHRAGALIPALRRS